MVNEAKYKKWLFLDTLLIIGMWLVFVISETYVIAYVLNAAMKTGVEIPMILLGFFALIMILMFIINGIACWNVRNSIKEHMYEFTYYD
ncbi:MAG: monomethylamine permease [Methanimicrococcus sp.]|nr:monomethylamine permease [Methanimicrococcus sp.]